LEEIKKSGITIVFASGNDSEDMDSYIHDESELDSVIGVSATNMHNEVTVYSNYGKNIDLLAPGGELEYGVGVLGLDDSGYFGSTMQLGLVNNNYAFTSGTSFAAPILSGVVALMVSVNPNISPNQIREILIKTADKIGYRPNYINGFDIYRAYGKINASKAVKMVKTGF
jgi:subtilisin family serine protease